MKCQILFSGKNKKNIVSLSSAVFAQSLVKVMIKKVTLGLFFHYNMLLVFIRIA